MQRSISSITPYLNYISIFQVNLMQTKCRWSRSALDWRRRRHKLWSPMHAASMRGVSPIMSLQFTSALATRSSFTKEIGPEALSSDSNGVSPKELVPLRLAPESSWCWRTSCGFGMEANWCKTSSCMTSSQGIRAGHAFHKRRQQSLRHAVVPPICR